MGLFGLTARGAQQQPPSAPMEEETTSSSKKWSEQEPFIALLETKINNLEEKLAHKDDVIAELQSGLQSNLECLNKLEEATTTSSSTSSLASTSRHSEFTAYQEAANNGNNCQNANNEEDSTIVTQLSNQLDDRNIEIANLEVKLEEQEMANRDLEERMKMAYEGKMELAAQMELLEKKLTDQQMQMESLTCLNETNASIMAELGVSSGSQPSSSSVRISSPPSSPTHPYSYSSSSSSSNGNTNKWEIYGKMQKLMDANNKLSHQLAKMADEKQSAERRVMDAQAETRQLMQQITQLGQQIDDKDKELSEYKQKKSSEENNTKESSFLSTSVLSEIQEILHIFADDGNNTDDDVSNEDKSQNNKEQSSEKLLKRALQVCQSQIQQLQRDREVFLQKTAKQSVALADSQALVDTLRGKVEHYETVLDSALKNKQTNALATSPVPEERRDPISTPTTIYDASSKCSPLEDSPVSRGSFEDNDNGDNPARPMRKLSLPAFLRKTTT